MIREPQFGFAVIHALALPFEGQAFVKIVNLIIPVEIFVEP